MELLEKIKEIQKLYPEPGNTLFIKLKEKVSEQELLTLTKYFNEFFKKKYGKVNVIVMNIDSDIQLIKGGKINE